MPSSIVTRQQPVGVTMRIKLSLLFALIVLAPAFGGDWTSSEKFQWPSGDAVFVFRGRSLNCVWRDGRPYVRRSDVSAAFKLPAEGEPHLDLIELLKERQYRVREFGGKIELAPPRAKAATGDGWGKRAEPSSAAGGAHESVAYKRAKAAFLKELRKGKIELARDRGMSERVSRIGNEIATVSRRNVPWNFFVIDDEEPNAFTTGEGIVAVSVGLLGLGLTDDELAGILAHEVAHGTEQHTMRVVTQNNQLARAEKEIEEARELEARYRKDFQRSTNGLDPSDMSYQVHKDTYESRMVTIRRKVTKAKKLLNNVRGQQKSEKELNHADEISADVVGMRYAVEAGYSAEGLRSALTKLQSRQVKKFGYAYSGEGKTHPPVSRRLEVLLKVRNDWQR